MFSKGQSFEYRLRASVAVALPLCLLLSACGSDGGFVANLPPPPATPTPTPTPTPRPTGVEVQTSWLDSPATRAGSYGVLGRLISTPGTGSSTSYRVVAPGEFVINSAHSSADSPLSYTLQAPTGALPGALTSVLLPTAGFTWTFNPGGTNFRDPEGGDYQQFFGENLKEYEIYPDGTKTLRENYDFARQSLGYNLPLSADKQLNTTFIYDVGYSYVAMGEWSWRVVDLNGAAAGDFGDLLFVNGDRTPGSGIPVAGTATYDARSLSLLSTSGTPGIFFTLTADFGGRTMSTRIDQDYRYEPALGSGGEPILGIHVGGTAAFSNNGLFDIPLAGTTNYSGFNSPITPAAQAVTGTLNGAFFGPHAEQVGGTFSLQSAGGATLAQDAFVGKQH